MAKKVRILVVSPGGMGSTALIEALRLSGFETNCPLDTDGLKHFPDPLDSRFSAFSPERVIYVWGDPLLAILSLDRRGWLEWQRFKITGIPFHYLNLELLWQNTLIAGSDVYGLGFHARRWAESCQWPRLLFDWRSLPLIRSRLEHFLKAAPRTLELNAQAHSDYDLEQVPQKVKDIYASLDRDQFKQLILRRKAPHALHRRAVLSF